MNIDEKAKLLLKHMGDVSECRVICDVVPSNVTIDVQLHQGGLGAQELKVKMDFWAPNGDVINIQDMVTGIPNRKFYLVEVIDE